jgi:hypothetical protein
MPRSLNGFVVPSFNKLHQHIIAPLRAGLRDRGYHEGTHYHLGKYGEEALGFPLPFNAPDKPSQIMHFIGGGAFQFFSLAVKGSMNGASVDSIIGDEVKLFQKEQYESECLPANRGNGNIFGHCHLHHGILLCTDMPMNQAGNWILEKEKLMDLDQIALIEQLQSEVDAIRFQIFTAPYSPRTIQDKLQEIAQLEAELHTLRRGKKSANGLDWEVPPAHYFSQASALDNIDILGEDYLDLQMANMTPIEFKASILNIRTEVAGQKFYPFFSPSTHGYAGKYAHAQDLGLDLEKEKPTAHDCSQDLDIHHFRPLDISFDYGASILTMVAGQEFTESFRLLNALHVLHPGKVSHLVAKFCDYYEGHSRKVVNYYFDHTAIGKDGRTDGDYSQDVVRAFQSRGWAVTEIYCGQAPGHEERYLYFQEYFRGETAAPGFEYNRLNCQSWETAMSLTALRSTAKGFEKDKRKERDAAFPQQKAPHYTDAFDTLIWFKYKRGIQSAGSAADWIVSK